MILTELLWSWAISVRLVKILRLSIVIHEWVIVHHATTIVAIISSVINLNRLFVFVSEIYVIVHWSYGILLERVIHGWTSGLSLWYGGSSGDFWRKLRLSSTWKRSTATTASGHGRWFMIFVLGIGSKSIFSINWNIFWFVNHQWSRLCLLLPYISHRKPLILRRYHISLIILLIIIFIITSITCTSITTTSISILCTPI